MADSDHPVDRAPTLQLQLDLCTVRDAGHRSAPFPAVPRRRYVVFPRAQVREHEPAIGIRRDGLLRIELIKVRKDRVVAGEVRGQYGAHVGVGNGLTIVIHHASANLPVPRRNLKQIAGSLFALSESERNEIAVAHVSRAPNQEPDPVHCV